MDSDAEYWKDRLDVLGRAVMESDKKLPSVKPETPQWNAWRNWYREKGIGVRFMDRQGAAGNAWTVVSEWPPMDDGGAILERCRERKRAGRLSGSVAKKLADGDAA